MILTTTLCNFLKFIEVRFIIIRINMFFKSERKETFPFFLLFFFPPFEFRRRQILHTFPVTSQCAFVYVFCICARTYALTFSRQTDVYSMLLLSFIIINWECFFFLFKMYDGPYYRGVARWPTPAMIIIHAVYNICV